MHGVTMKILAECMKSYSKGRKLKIIHCVNVSTTYFSESAYKQVG